MKNFDNFKINYKKVLFRADLNVPVVNSQITDKSRIKSIKPSIRKLLKQKNKIFMLNSSTRV